eukprot:GHVS01014834.1.p1 GENE.GHVS01014834.1~~GHVS01014834.1.p1  ORF type:complete len:215 (+),score=87.18 GHVS01014834.1:210-854(+)
MMAGLHLLISSLLVFSLSSSSSSSSSFGVVQRNQQVGIQKGILTFMFLRQTKSLFFGGSSVASPNLQHTLPPPPPPPPPHPIATATSSTSSSSLSNASVPCFPTSPSSSFSSSSPSSSSTSSSSANVPGKSKHRLPPYLVRAADGSLVAGRTAHDGLSDAQLDAIYEVCERPGFLAECIRQTQVPRLRRMGRSVDSFVSVPDTPPPPTLPYRLS